MDFIDWLQSGVGYPEEFFFATLGRVSQQLYNEQGIIVQSMYYDMKLIYYKYVFYVLGSIFWSLLFFRLRR